MRKGFTLVELSIVLVIIGLLIGGILIGQSLVDSTRINAQIKQIEQYDIAVSTFKSKFRCLPADCDNFSYELYPGSNRIGDGDGIIDHHVSNANIIGNEAMNFFAALSSASMINEYYSGCNSSYNCAGTGNHSGMIGNLWPYTKLAEEKGMIVQGTMQGGFEYWLAINQSVQPFISNLSDVAIIPVNYALALDKKMDDGFASTGIVYASTRFVTVNSSCGQTALCAGRNDPTAFQIDTVNGVCTNSGTPRTYNTGSGNFCKIAVTSKAY